MYVLFNNAANIINEYSEYKLYGDFLFPYNGKIKSVLHPVQYFLSKVFLMCVVKSGNIQRVM